MQDQQQEDESVGVGFKDWERTHYVLEERFNFDKYDVPSKRTQYQKFEISCKQAINQLVDFNLISNDAANDFINEFIPKINESNRMMNGAALALIFCCYDFNSKKFLMDHRSHVSWNYIKQIIENPKKVKRTQYRFEDFIKDNRITIPDLIRYLIKSKSIFEI